MSIILKRNTGVMGGATRITIKANNAKLTSLKNNEETKVNLPEEKAQITANQWFFGSKPILAKAGDSLEVQMNNTALLLFIISLIVFFAGLFLNQIYLMVIGIVLILGIAFYAMNNWFIVTSSRN